MNNLKQIIKAENRNTFLNYFRMTSYLAHPELKVKVSNKRWKNLMTMRDLRLWIQEYAPFSSRTPKYADQVEQITREIQYLSFFGNNILIPAFSKRFLIFAAVILYISFFGPQHLRGGMDLGSRPV